MSLDIIKKIDDLIEEYENDLINDTIALVNINSEQSEPLPNAPFGAGPREVLDTVMKWGKREGFYVEDYGVGVISLSLQQGTPELGIWAHGDVVPAGEGWDFEPYNAVLYKNCIIGRGATDNKGQLSAIFNLFRIFKKLGIKFNYVPALYVGSNEEYGMKDMKGVPGNPDAKGFNNVCTPPRLSLVPDSGFPIGYGARGLATFRLKSRKPLCDVSLTAGLDDAPGLATAIFKSDFEFDELSRCSVDKKNKTVTAFSLPRHTANPDPEGNMITYLASALCDCGEVCDSDKEILKFFKDISLDVHGSMFGINVKTEQMKPTVVYAKTIRDIDGYPELEIKIRYPIEITSRELFEQISDVCEKYGFDTIFDSGHNPYLHDCNSELVKTLADVANEVTGDNAPPHVSGSTYAHYLPNAYTYGMNGCLPPDDFPKGRGGAHGIDECVSVERLKRAMRIYARAMLRLNDIEW